MKTSLRKLRGGFALHRQAEAKAKDKDRKEPCFHQPLSQLDELSRASQDMQGMRDCYDSLLSAAAATANSAYEFSESLREMGACLLQKTALNEDEESGRVLLMLGKLQFELQKLLDHYRSHISQTITIPSESLLNELRIVEEMKRQCDEKRDVYEYMVTRHREKGRLRNSKGEKFTFQQLQAARDEYDEEATLFVFRLKSLKRGQSRSLLIQAARHHAAQLCFFRKSLRSLETVEPHVKLVTKQQHIDYHFSGLEDDDGDDGGSNYLDDDGYDTHDDGELSFDYGQNDQDQDVSTSSNSMELDHVELTFPQFTKVDAAKENLYRNPGGDSLAFGRDQKINSQSAPLFAEKNFDPAERFRQLQQSSTRKVHSYMLPTPVETKSVVSTNSDTPNPRARVTNLGGGTLNIWHSSPLEQRKNEKILRNKELSGPIVMNTESILKESNNYTIFSRLPPLTEGISVSRLGTSVTSDAIKMKRQAFSGPLSSKSWSKKAALSACGPTASTRHPQLFSGPLLRNPLPRPSSSPKVSPNASPKFFSSPKLSELHELPRPPAYVASKSAARPSNFVGHSCPLVSRGPELSAANKLVAFSAASPLPTSPLTVPRSFSIPSRGQSVTLLPVSKLLEEPHGLKIAEDINSPPLTPISLSNIQPESSASATVIPSGQSRVPVDNK